MPRAARTLKAAPPSPQEMIDRTLARMVESHRNGCLHVEGVPGVDAAKRGLEIAVAGDHAVRIGGATERDRLVALHLVAAFERDGMPLRLAPADGRGAVEIQLHVPDADLILPTPAEPGTVIAGRVEAVRGRERPPARLDYDASRLMNEAVARQYVTEDRRDDVVAVARTIAALSGHSALTRQHIAQALCYVRDMPAEMLVGYDRERAEPEGPAATFGPR